MAKPAFIYAFDNLGPARFAELCGLLLASHYKGFILGGVGADGGVDGEIDDTLGTWRPESLSPLLTEIIQPGQLVVFQFKHKVTARVGQAQSREQLLSLFKCRSAKKCELHRRLIVEKQPTVYVLVTNVEVNSLFRSKFIEQCKSENENIKHYQIIGLDELVTWVSLETRLRHLFFPNIFGPPRFELQIQVSEGATFPFTGLEYLEKVDLDFDRFMRILVVAVLNTGIVPSYVSSITFKAIVDGEIQHLQLLDFGNETMKTLNNPRLGSALEPGRRQEYRFPFGLLRGMQQYGNEVFPTEVLICDEIGNTYSAVIPEDLRSEIILGPITWGELLDN